MGSVQIEIFLWKTSPFLENTANCLKNPNKQLFYKTSMLWFHEHFSDREFGCKQAQNECHTKHFFTCIIHKLARKKTCILKMLFQSLCSFCGILFLWPYKNIPGRLYSIQYRYYRYIPILYWMCIILPILSML